MAADSPSWEQPETDFSRVKALVFDLGNVLLDLDNSRYGKGWPGDLAAGREDFESWQAAHAPLWHRYETGAIDTLDFLHQLSSELQLSRKHVTDFWNAILLPGIAPRRYETLARYAQHYPLYVLSNTNAIHIDWVREHVAAAGQADFETRYFKQVFYSYREGAAKPDGAFYAALEAGVAEAPASLLFIDDKLENVEAAIQRGWQAIWLRPGRPVEEVLPPLT